MPGHAAQAVGVLIVHPPHDRRTPPQSVRGGAAPDGARRRELRLGHPGGGEEPLAHELVQGHTGRGLDDPPQQQAVEIAVLHAAARRAEERLLHDQLSQGGGIPGRPVERPIRRQARGVRQEVAHGHTLFSGPLEIGQVALHQPVEPHLSQVHQQHDRRRGGYHLGERREIV